jgi:hypothetical protein
MPIIDKEIYFHALFTAVFIGQSSLSEEQNKAKGAPGEMLPHQLTASANRTNRLA